MTTGGNSGNAMTEIALALAVPLDLTLGQILAAKLRLPVTDITVTTLDHRLSSTLKEMQK